MLTVCNQYLLKCISLLNKNYIIQKIKKPQDICELMLISDTPSPM